MLFMDLTALPVRVQIHLNTVNSMLRQVTIITATAYLLAHLQ